MTGHFLRFVLPSMLAFAFSGLYSIIDGLFIGRVLGDPGLAAVNFAYPLTVLIQAVGAGLGMGGAVGISLCLGRRHPQRAQLFLGNCLVLLLLASMGLSALLTPLAPALLRLFGATGLVYTHAAQYAFYICLGSSFQVLATGLAPLLRCHGKPGPAMAAMVAGFSINILLDWLFIPILGYGMAGAAWATLLGQAVTLLLCAFFLASQLRPLRARCFRPRAPVIPAILQTALSPFGLALSPYIVLILMNKAAFHYGGDSAVAAYAVLSYVSSTVYLLMQGVGDGSQPLMSYSTGQGNPSQARLIRRLAWLLAGLIAALCAALMLAFRVGVPQAFGASPAVALLAARVMPLFAAGFLMVAYLRVTTAFLYATRANTAASILIYAEPVLVALLLLILPPFAGLDGVWLTIPLAQATTCLLATRSRGSAP